MNEATRAKVDELLRAHPRYEAHFTRLMPREVSREDAATQSRWAFAQSSVWPDLVRNPDRTIDREDVNRFNRPYWHFINQPVFLNDDERRKLESGLKLYVNRELSDDRDDPGMNIIQAFKNSSRIVADPSVSADVRAVHICWLAHLAGDSHQPMHSAALFTANRFPEGDHGGGDLDIERDWSLHSFWDDQVCTQRDFSILQVLAAVLTDNEKKAAAGQKAAKIIDIEKWIDESNVHARKFAYTQEVLDKVGSRETHSHLGPLNLSPEYRADAESIAERRAVEAGYRLGKLMDDRLNQT